jgi:4-deoxy-L-threo-5-hexosulose-uronate ketol-isomerase
MENKGGVGSYPPHFHGPDGPHGLGKNAKEEIYHFRCVTDIDNDVPYVLQNCALPEEKVNTYVHVFDEVAINVTPTYHDTIAPPSVDFMFTWCLGSFKEGHRDWAEIYNKPGFENEW